MVPAERTVGTVWRNVEVRPVTSRLSVIAGCLGMVCVPVVTAAQSADVDTLDAGPGAVALGAPGDAGVRDALEAALPAVSIDATPAVAATDPAVDARDTADGSLAGDAPLAAQRIIDRALEQAVRQRAVAFELGFEYFTDGRVESLDGDGRATDTKTTRNRHYPLEGHFYSEIIGRDGRPLDEDEARDEREKRADFVREARRHAARGERYEPDEMRVDFDRELMDRYVATLAGTDVVDGAVCWVIEFEPREGPLPNNRRLDGALNRSSGRLWIGQHDYGVRRAVFEMQRPVRWLWGIAGTLRRATGQLDFRQIESNLWIPDRTLVEIEMGVFFGLKTIRRRIHNEWVDAPHPESPAVTASLP